MAEKKNCWEMKQCGREPGGSREKDLGACPASTASACDGLNSGRNGGRICWAVTGTLCGGRIQGSCAQKRLSCVSCLVFETIRKDEGPDFVLLRPGQIYRPHR